MHLKTFHAPSIQDAIRQARRELGSDAMLLSSRRMTGSGEANSVFAVTFATAVPPPAATHATTSSSEVKSPEASPRSVAGRAGSHGSFRSGETVSDIRTGTDARPKAARATETQQQAGAQAASPSARHEPSPGHARSSGGKQPTASAQVMESGDDARDSRSAHDFETAHDSRAVQPSPQAGVSPLAAGAALSNYETLFEQMTSMRREMLQLAGSVRRASAATYRQDLPHEELRWAYDVLASQDFYPELIEEVIEQMAPRFASVPAPEPTGAKSRKRRRAPAEEPVNHNGLLPLLRETLSSRIELAPEPSLRRRSGSPHLVALVGPPGVGKTTTLVKLAARYGANSRFPLQIISMDNYRVAASEQLRTYASVLGIGFDALPSAASLQKTLRQYEAKELILIDTPGYGWRDFPAAEDLAGVLRNAGSATIHLVVSASMKPGDLSRVADLYELFGYHSILFTKVDETSTIGPLVSESALRRKPLSYLCGGQRIPEDLEVATRDRILERVLPASLSSGECAA